MFVKIQTLFHKTDPTGTLNGLRSTKPRKFILQGISMCSHAQPRAQNAPRLSLSIPRKYARDFRNGQYEEIHRAPIYKTQKFQARTMSHTPPESPEIFASTNTRLHLPSRAHTRRKFLMRRHAPWRHGWHIHPLWSEPLAKKKKKLWPSRTLTLTKKSKFSKMACSTQFFEYIPILRSVSSFETRKLCKLSNS